MERGKPPRRQNPVAEPPVQSGGRRRLTAPIVAARDQHGSDGFMGTIDAYCEARECAVRQVAVHAKEYDSLLPGALPSMRPAPASSERPKSPTPRSAEPASRPSARS
jgi:hypothetical protein